MTKILPVETVWSSNIEPSASQYHFTTKKTLFSARTRFQDVSVVDSHEYGKLLLIDGCCQSTQMDEFIYHESLVHPALTALPLPRHALVIGGGEGATLREILRHPSIERVVMVDIDAELVDICERFLPEWHRGAFDDPRVDLILEDGKKYVANTDDTFDAIFIDICEPLAESKQSMYSVDFYQSIKNRLSPGGAVVVQTQDIPENATSEHFRLYHHLSQVFAHVDSYRSYMPSFFSIWSFLIANDVRKIATENTNDIDLVLAHRGVNKHLRYYDGETHRHMFSLTKVMRKMLGTCHDK